VIVAALLAPGAVALEAPRVAHAAPALVCRVLQAPDIAPPDRAWAQAADALARDLAAAPGACNGIALTLAWERGGARLLARTPDGLTTSRRVTSPEALSAVAFGLIAAAPVERVAPGPDPRDLPPPEARVGHPAPLVSPFDLVSRISVSAAAGLRAAFPTNVLMVDFELRADLVVHGWLVTLTMRAAPTAEPSRLPTDSDAYEEAAVGLGLGREVRFGSSAIDLGAGPNVTYVWMESDGMNLSAEELQLRLAGVARWGYTLSRHVRVNATLDGELAPSALIHTGYQAGLAPFPAVTVGLRLGAEVAL
jgi:hypothetical protein